MTGWALIACLGILALRLPSFLEPAWHTDEGTFAGVAEGIVRGRDLYSQAWESKPPLFLYLYAAIFKLFGAGLIQLKFAVAGAALSSQFLVFLTGRRFMSPPKALCASIFFGVLIAVPFWEGNLALSEVFSMPPTLLALWIGLARSERDRSDALRWLGVSGALFGTAFLLRQPAVLAMPALVLWLLLSSRLSPQRLIYMGAGFVAPLVLTTIAFAVFGSFHWYWDANVSYFLYYVPAGSRVTSTLMLWMVLPTVVSLTVLVATRLRREEPPSWALPAMWFGFAFVGALLNGKDYSHYLLQTFPPLALLTFALMPARLAMPSSLLPRPAFVIAASFGIAWFIVINAVFYDPLGMHWTKGPEYYAHTLRLVTGRESRAKYEMYFDKRVRTTEALDQEFEAMRAQGKTVYIWGEYPWVYALSSLEPFSRYVTSYSILESDERSSELLKTLTTNPPDFIVVAGDVEPKPNRSPTKERFVAVASRLHDLLANRYSEVARAGNAMVYELKDSQTADRSPR
jgi:4-amino-4-deoxy-L-arabinose transferase-like glycosyltransferase